MIQHLILPETLRKRLDHHAENTYPNECCGILLGTKKDGRIIEAVPTDNSMRRTHARRAFAVPLLSVLMIRRYLKPYRHLRLLGFYHTHPDAPAVPSGDDITLAWPRHVYLIASVRRGAVRPWHAWALDDNPPAEIPLTIIQPVLVTE